MKYLVKTIKHTTGEEFTDIIKVKNNETYQIIEAESKEEALSYNEVSGDKNNLSVEEMRKRLKSRRK